MVTVRQEVPADHRQVLEVNRLAFGRPEEAQLVEALRMSASFVPELSLVASEEDRVVGHVLFTRVAIRDGGRRHPALALAPVAVLPERQRSGIGSTLIRHGVEAARALGYGIAIVLGHSSYYPRLGFVPAERVGIRAPFEVTPGAFMVLELQPGALAGVQGEVEYPPEFSNV
jgi:putative acetyltransferase